MSKSVSQILSDAAPMAGRVPSEPGSRPSDQAPAGLDAPRVDPSRECRNCAGGAWVCENHQDRPWDGVSTNAEACGCGAGAPCPVCSPDLAFAGRRSSTIEACAAVAEAPFDWPIYEAPRTYRALANSIGAKIRALQFASQGDPA